jgi:hypothetical protein
MRRIPPGGRELSDRFSKHPLSNVHHVELAAHRPNAGALPHNPSEGAYIHGTASELSELADWSILLR